MATLLDTLVKLASLGASGVCIFAIFWIGWIIYRLPSDAGSERYKSLRMFMLTTLGIAVISGVTGVTNAAWNQGEIAKLESAMASQAAEIGELQEMRDTVTGMVSTLDLVLVQKELAAAAEQSAELEGQVEILKGALSNVKAMLDGDGR